MTETAGGEAGRFVLRPAIAAWCLYDWANSAFPAVITTFVFATYFTQAVAPDPTTGTALWGHALAASGLIIAVLSPLLGAAADAGGQRMPWLAGFTLLSIVAMALLWLAKPSPDYVLIALVAFALANIGFEMATVFYNALLPDIVQPTHLGRVSGWGWGLGYVGGIVCLSLLLVMFVQADRPLLGLDTASLEHVRVAGPFSALWYTLFAIPLFVLVRERRKALSFAAALREGLGDLMATLRTLPRHGGIAWFLLAHMIYADGLVTLFGFGAIYAAGSFGMDTAEVIVFGIALNVTAGLGAFGFAWVDDWLGPRRTIALGLVALIAIGGAMLVIVSKTQFWALGLLLGAFFGPVQAASRSYMARLAPADARTQMFGLYAVSGKATAFVGPAVLGWTTLAFDSQRAGMATILVFFLVGLAILWRAVPDPAPAGPNPLETRA
jgi:UMF1 family MFS transporter